jgi:hypothetical protein
MRPDRQGMDRQRPRQMSRNRRALPLQSQPTSLDRKNSRHLLRGHLKPGRGSIERPESRAERRGPQRRSRLLRFATVGSQPTHSTFPQPMRYRAGVHPSTFILHPFLHPLPIQNPTFKIQNFLIPPFPLLQFLRHLFHYKGINAA